MSFQRFITMQSESPLQPMSAVDEISMHDGFGSFAVEATASGTEASLSARSAAAPAGLTAVQVSEATLAPTGLFSFALPPSPVLSGSIPSAVGADDVRLSETGAGLAAGLSAPAFSMSDIGIDLRETAIDGIGPLRWDDGFLGFAQAQLAAMNALAPGSMSQADVQDVGPRFPAEPRREDFFANPGPNGDPEAAFAAAVASWKAQIRAINEAIGPRDFERTTVPTEPQLANLWHINNVGQTLTGPSYGVGNPDEPRGYGTQTNTINGVDANVLQVLADYNGQGIVVGVFDDGAQYTHPDLTGSYDPLRHVFNLFGGVQTENDPLTFLDNNGQNDSHGTAVSGLIAADANGVGVIGVAPGATLVGVDLPFGGAINNAPSGQSFDATGGQFRNFDISNNSWGNRAGFGFTEANSPLFFAGLTDTALNGRGGLGSIVVKSAGNNRLYLVDSNSESFNASRYAIAVAALASDGFAASYSSYGSNILITGHSQGFSPNTLNYGVLTTDRTGASGYNATDYAQFNGTSAAAPVVSGVIALMLDANPNLSARDVQQILAYSARIAGSAVDTDTITGNGEASFATEGQFRTRFNGAENWNGGGLHFSNNYGFGQVDARAAVRLAENWTSVGTWNNEQSVTQTITPSTAIPDNNTPISFTFTLAAGVSIESVRVTLGMTHTFASDLVITLTSPSGTVSEILTRPFPNGGATAFPSGYSVSSQQFRGEQSGGTWTITFRDVFAADAGFANSLTLTAFGSTNPVNDRYVFTDEYGAYSALTGRNTLEDTDGGNDTLDASALSGSATIRLTAGSISQIAGQNLTVVAGAVIENAFGGDGNDTLEGTSADNELRGGRGNDWIDGGAGADRLSGGAGRDTFVLSASGGGIDTITDFNLLEDGLFLNGSVITGVSGLYDADLDGQADDTYVSHSGGALVLLNTAFVTASLAGTSGGNDTINGTAGADVGIGDNGNDSISGLAGDDALDGGVGDDSLFSGAGKDTVFGGLGNDFINITSTGRGLVDGGAGNDYVAVSGAANPQMLEGGDGVDTIFAVGVTFSDGFDGQFQGFEAIEGGTSISGGAGGQKLDIQTLTSIGTGLVTLDGGAGNDTLVGGAGRDLLVGGTERDVLMGYGGNDTLQGGDGADWLFGGDGNDTLTGGAGADEFFFGSVSAFGLDVITDYNVLEDIIQFSPTAGLTGLAGGLDLDGNGVATDVRMTTALGTVGLVNIGAGSASLGGGGADTLIGAGSGFFAMAGAGNDSVVGTAAADTLYGDAGIDLFTPGAGSDIIFGGTDNDAVIYTLATQQIVADLNAGYASGTDIGFDRLFSIEGITGGGGDDILVGTAGVNAILGGLGADYIEGRDGNDSLGGEAGSDTILGGVGNDIVLGGAGSDFLYGGTGVDTITFADLAAAVVFNAATGYAGSGSVFDFVQEFESFIFTGFNDTVIGWTGPVYDLGSGDDYFSDGAAVANGGGAINNTIFAGIGADIVYSGEGNDLVDGGAGNDFIVGGDGADTLTGGDGIDYLNGGAGNDVFRFISIAESTPTARDNIDAWNTGDRIDLAAIDANTGVAGDQAFTVGALASGQAGRLQLTPGSFSGTNYVLVQGDVNGDGVADFAILVLNATSLAGSDFVL
jgi:Ca2+-binding RTX toxin-like protein/subtilisin-like proprotein convertase family protein